MMKSMIIKDQIQQLMKGHPTVSDKYNVSGAILEGTSGKIGFGELVAFTGTPGYYTKAVGTALPSAGLAGLSIAPNVKLVKEYGDPSAEAEVAPGEAFDLLLDGYITAVVEITANTFTNLAANKPVYYKLGASSTAAIVLADSAAGTAALTGYTFTGVYEVIDSTHVIAEIRVK